ncbi:MAG TPA: PEGA domain-containing protein, partial [Kofleriaceae bacterium]|nr:PEGA domain-containing protein [Kofleriaceae bacterium]
RAYSTQPPNTRSRVASRGSAVVPSRSRTWLLALAGVAAIAIVAAVWFATRPSDDLSSPAAGPTNPAPGPTSPTAGPTNPVPAAPPASAFVIATIDGVPDGTEVSVAGVTVGVAPGPVQLPRGTDQLVLTFKVDGYLPQSRTITPDRDQRFAVALKKKGVTAPPPVRSRKDDILDPFGTHP